jgi:hypothetical protein
LAANSIWDIVISCLVYSNALLKISAASALDPHGVFSTEQPESSFKNAFLSFHFSTKNITLAPIQ